MCKKLSGWLKCSLSHWTGVSKGGSIPCITTRLLSVPVKTIHTHVLSACSLCVFYITEQVAHIRRIRHFVLFKIGNCICNINCSYIFESTGMFTTEVSHQNQPMVELTSAGLWVCSIPPLLLRVYTIFAGLAGRSEVCNFHVQMLSTLFLMQYQRLNSPFSNIHSNIILYKTYRKFCAIIKRYSGNEKTIRCKILNPMCESSSYLYLVFILKR